MVEATTVTTTGSSIVVRRHSPTAFVSSSSTANSHTPFYLAKKNPSYLRRQQALFSTNLDQLYNADLLTSTSSGTVKRFVMLNKKASERRKAGEVIVEGPRMVLDLLKNPATHTLMKQILLSTDVDENIQQELHQILKDTASHDNLSIQMATPQVIKACSDTVTPQGIVARVQLPTWSMDSMASSPQQQPKQAPLYLILDGVSDPGNVGTLLRSSVAVGVQAVLLLPGSCDVWNPKAIRSAMVGSFLVPTLSVGSWSEARDMLRECKVGRVFAATMLEDQQTGQVLSAAHYDIDWNSEPSALIIGSEGTGLSQEIRQSLHSDSDSSSNSIRAVHVPMEGTIESLNAAICGSVILFEYMRQWKQQ